MLIETNADADDFFVVTDKGRALALADLVKFLYQIAPDDPEYRKTVLNWVDRGISRVLKIPVVNGKTDVWRIER